MAIRWLIIITTALLAGGAAAQGAPALEDPEEKRSYALGMAIGSKFRSDSIAVDPDLYIQGFRDALSGGETLLTEAELRAIVNDLRRELRRRQIALQSGKLSKNKQGGSATDTAPTVATLTDIKVSFKLDPRLTHGVYMGDRWVSPPTYTRVQEPGKPLTVDARVEGLDAKGRPMSISPDWIPSDPDMVTVTPDKDGAVNIIVQHTGESRLMVTAAGVSRELFIRAKSENDAMQVEIAFE